MKLLSVIENISDEYGGPANSLPNLLNALKDSFSIESVVYSIARDENEKNEFLQRYSIPWIKCDPKLFTKLQYSSELKSRLKQDIKKGDIIFSNNLWNYPSYLSDRLSREKSVAHIISIRGTLYPWSLSQGKFRKKLAWYLFQKRALQRANLIHVTCKEELKALRELGITTPAALVPHGINFNDYQTLPNKSDAKDGLSLDHGQKYFLFMSRLHKKKGLDMLLDVWYECSEKHPNWTLLIAGPDYGNYKEKIEDLELNSGQKCRVKLLGMLKGENKRKALSASEFFVLPSYSENFGVVIGEALAAGLPTLTTRGTPWNSINEFSCGQQIELNKVNLTKALDDMLLLDENELVTMSSNAKKLIKEKYSWHTQAEKFSKALEFVIDKTVDTSVIYK